MALPYTRIEVVVSGAVRRSGRTRLEAGATVAQALRAAGGLAYESASAPAGALVLRRRLPSSRAVSVFRWSLFEDDAQPWRTFRLEQRDVLVFEWSVREGAA